MNHLEIITNLLQELEQTLNKYQYNYNEELFTMLRGTVNRRCPIFSPSLNPKNRQAIVSLFLINIYRIYSFKLSSKSIIKNQWEDHFRTKNKEYLTVLFPFITQFKGDQK